MYLREKNVESLTGNPNITLYDGTASFVCEDTVKVTLASGKDEKSFAIFRGFMPAGVTNLSRSRIAELLVK